MTGWNVMGVTFPDLAILQARVPELFGQALRALPSSSPTAGEHARIVKDAYAAKAAFVKARRDMARSLDEQLDAAKAFRKEQRRSNASTDVLREADERVWRAQQARPNFKRAFFD